MKFNFNKKANFDEENLDNIWVVDMWLDNMDSKDGHDHIEFTKIGLIDFLNNEIKDYNSTNGADYTVLDRNATNKEVKEFLYDLLEGKVVEIKPYNEKSANKKVKSDKEKTIQEYEEMGLDMSDLMKACVYVHYGFYDEIKKKWSPEKLYYYLEERLKEAQDNPNTAEFEKSWASTRFPEALKLILHWFDTNVETTWKDLDSQASKEVNFDKEIDSMLKQIKSSNIEYKTEEIMNHFRNKNKKVFNWFDEDNGSVIKNGNDIYIETHSFGNVPNYIYNAVKDWAFSNGYSFYTKTANKKCAAVTKQIGRWLLKLVKAGETTNRGNGEFINKGKGDEYDIVEIYDTKAEPRKFTEYGQFVSDYYVSTFLKHNGGLSMVGYVPAWTMSAAEVKEAQEWLKSLYSNGNPKDFLEETMAEFRKKNKTASKKVKSEEVTDEQLEESWNKYYPLYRQDIEAEKMTEENYPIDDEVAQNLKTSLSMYLRELKRYKKAIPIMKYHTNAKMKRAVENGHSKGLSEDEITKQVDDIAEEYYKKEQKIKPTINSTSENYLKSFVFNIIKNKTAKKQVKAEEEPKIEVDVLFKLEPLDKIGIDGFDVVAWFVDDPTACYAHVGQHSSCSPEYMEELEDAKFTDYEYLLKELENIGYEVNVMNSDYKQQKKASKEDSGLILDKEYANFNYSVGEDGTMYIYAPDGRTINEISDCEDKNTKELEDLMLEVLDNSSFSRFNKKNVSKKSSRKFTFNKKEAGEEIDKVNLDFMKDTGDTSYALKLLRDGIVTRESRHFDQLVENILNDGEGSAAPLTLLLLGILDENDRYYHNAVKQCLPHPTYAADLLERGIITKDSEYYIDAVNSAIRYEDIAKKLVEKGIIDEKYVQQDAERRKEQLRSALSEAILTLRENGKPFYDLRLVWQDKNEPIQHLKQALDEAASRLDKLGLKEDAEYYRGLLKQASKKVKAGTSNFNTQDDYPLIAIGDDNVWPKESFVEWYNEENPENKIDTWEQEDVEYYQLLPDLYDDFTIEMEHYLKNADIPEGWNITIKPGYYEGVQLWVEEPNDFEYYFEQGWLDDKELGYDELTPEQKAELQNAMQAQYEKEKAQVAQIMIDAAKACGWLQLKVDWRASNGETGYSVVKSGLSENGVEKLKQVSEVVETKNNIAILKSKMTGNYILFDYNTNDFLDDELYNDLASAESALEDYTEEIGNDILSDLADDLVLDIKDVNAVKEKLATVSKDNSDYGKIEEEQIADIARETGVNNTDVKTIALELGYMVK